VESEAPRKPSRNLLAFSLIINVLFAFLACYAIWHWQSLRIQMNSLLDSYRKIEQELNLTKTQMEYYKKQAEYYSSLISSGEATRGVIGHASIPIVAIRTIQRGFSIQYEGVVMTADVELREGKGRILVNTVPKIGIDVQTSVITAVKVAEKITGVSLGKTDVILTIKASQEVNVVDGPSAGAAITIALIAAIRGDSLNRTVYITGTINNDESIGAVGGIAEKALAAAANGSRVFLVPKGQSRIVMYVPHESHPFPGMTIIKYEKKLMSLQDYLKEAGYSIIVKETETIEDAYREFTGSSLLG